MQGERYTFRVEARNAIGYSTPSAEITILCAIVPSQIAPPDTSVDVNSVVITWQAPVTDNGSPISSYKVLIRHSETSSYSEDLDNCDGSDPTIMAQLFCTIPFDVLTAAPWTLGQGTSVFAKIVATNEIGDSEESTAGNGATLVISSVPDAPIGLARDSLTTTTTQIGLLWFAGTSDGGQPLLDYRIWYD